MSDKIQTIENLSIGFKSQNGREVSILKDISTNKLEGELTSQNLRKFHRIEVLKELEFKNIF